MVQNHGNGARPAGRKCKVCQKINTIPDSLCSARCRILMHFRLNPKPIKLTKIKCLYCKKKFQPTSSKIKYCDRDCYNNNRRGVSHTWGYKISISLKGVPKSPEHVAKVASANRGQIRENTRNENHWAWKGDDAKYDTKHDWVYYRLGAPKKCSHCGDTKKKWYHWANISGKYKRDIKDWIRLCVKCHSAFDKSRGRGTILMVKTKINKYGAT